jgi:NitT/TauT family transport system ATP-binding protein
MSRAAVAVRSVAEVWTPEARAPVEALRDLSLEVAPGEVVVLLGLSGCGKSTLLYMIAGLEAATAGGIECDGVPVAGPSAERGLILQEASLFAWLTILDNVAFGLTSQGVATA